jgi:hypothetical protein
MRTYDSATEQAFFETCDQAEEAQDRFVSLYRNSRFYGGPEEGGWWGNDITLVATQRFPTEAQAEAAKARLEILRDKLNRGAQADHGDVCLDQLDACDWDGEEAQARYGEVDGPEEYYVAIEETPGSQEHRSSRYYE